MVGTQCTGEIIDHGFVPEPYNGRWAILPAFTTNRRPTVSVYTDNGYKSRKDYIEGLAEDRGLPIGTVLALAAILGQEEDFDGLVTACQDAADGKFDDYPTGGLL